MARRRYCSLIRRLTFPPSKSGCTQANEQFDGDMMKYADDTNVSEHIVDHADITVLCKT
ncbi:Hypothetical predicted protein [Paramuricea clavata]|uniref:Uncharacterized protein n=1 Tax=Paramuricea clavata TaxID=317549 RepID=A0A7D9EKQ4_PARCT|nr:Hypothetical predicted protein [Paramuricea clavata]